jgi:HAD superfamily hydrolase (TIGR01509 family)
VNEDAQQVFLPNLAEQTASPAPACEPARAVTLAQLRPRVRAVVFDMDGVLLLSNAVHERAYREVLSPFDVAFNYSDYAGMRTPDSLREILRTNGIRLAPEALQDLSRRKTALALERLETENPIAPAGIAVLQHLGPRYPLALATSASRITAAGFVRRNGLEGLFRAVITGEDVTRAKPAPDVFLEACKRLSVAPAHSLVVEDAISGVLAAVSAGAIPVAVAGTAPAASLLAAGAEMVLHGLEDLLSL